MIKIQDLSIDEKTPNKKLQQYLSNDFFLNLVILENKKK
jgi:hypothetical protein